MSAAQEEHQRPAIERLTAWMARPIEQRGAVALVVGGRRGGKATVAIEAVRRFKQARRDAVILVHQPNGEHMARVGECGGTVVHSPEALKRGAADVVVLCHADELPSKALVWAAWTVAPRSGCVIVTANPPCTTEAAWLGRLYGALTSGTVRGLLLKCESLTPSPPDAVREVLREVSPDVARPDLGLSTWEQSK